MSKKKREYNRILEEFNIEKYNNMNMNKHHGLTRYEHSLRVAKSSFYISYILGGDVTAATRGALLHDFFTDNDIDKERFLEYLHMHPEIALENAKKYFKVNDLEEEIIITHMFPFGTKKPKSKEAWIVSISDKYISLYEVIKYLFVPKKY